MLVARLLDEPAARECEARAVMHGLPRRGLQPGQPLRPGKDAYLEEYVPCFAERLTPALLLHRLQRTARLPWLRFLFPREGWQ